MCLDRRLGFFARSCRTTYFILTATTVCNLVVSYPTSMAAAFACICGGVGVLALIRRHHLIVFFLLRAYGCAMNIVQCDSQMLPIHRNAEVSIRALPRTDRQQFIISSAVNLQYPQPSPAIYRQRASCSKWSYFASLRHGNPPVSGIHPHSHPCCC